MFIVNRKELKHAIYESLKYTSSITLNLKESVYDTSLIKLTTLPQVIITLITDYIEIYIVDINIRNVFSEFYFDLNFYDKLECSLSINYYLQFDSYSMATNNMPLINYTRGEDWKLACKNDVLNPQSHSKLFTSLHYFFNKFMRVQYNEQNYLNLSKNKLRYCKINNTIYVNVDMNHYYVINECNNECLKLVIIICKTILKEIKMIINEIKYNKLLENL